jgi:hypothetical protein
VSAPTNQPDEQLREKLLLVQKILQLPVNNNSSALKHMDAWSIADFIVEREAGIRQAIAKELPEKKNYFNRSELKWKAENDNRFNSRDSAMYDQGYNMAIDACRAAILGGKDD